MNVTPLPKAKPLSDVLAAAGAPLDQPAHPTVAAVKAIEDDLAWAAWDTRAAMAMNMIDECMRMGNHPHKTDSHARHFRAIMQHGHEIVFGDGAEAPNGFGEPVRVQMTQAAKDALARLLAIEAAARVAKDAPGTQEVAAGDAGREI